MFDDLNESKGRGNWIFMQDGASCHTSVDSKVWLSSRCRFISKWPANSPDLNPIENLWGCMKKAVSIIKPVSIDDLRGVIKQVWDNYPMNSINNLVKSFLQRLQFVLFEKGHSIQNHLRRGISELNFPIDINPNDQYFIHDVITEISEKQPEIPVFRNVNEPFTPEEDQLILKNFMIHGRNWKKNCSNSHR